MCFNGNATQKELSEASASGNASSTESNEAASNAPTTCTKAEKQLDSAKQGYIDSFPYSVQLFILGFAMVIAFTIHNLLQESIMGIPGFKFGVMLGYMEVTGVTICSFLERRYIAKEKGLNVPISEYPILTLCLLGSSALSNWSLNFINFPTKVVFRGCKLIPTMFIATLMHRKVYSLVEYTCALCACIGLVMFAAADWTLAPNFNPIGLVLVSLSVCADAVLPNAQERLFKMGASRLEVTMCTNFFTLIAMTVTTLLSGDFMGVVRHAIQDSRLASYMAVFTALSYIAISLYMVIIKRFGGVVAVLLGTARKVMTLVLSFLLFPKQFSWFYLYGSLLIFGGGLTISLYKQMKKDPLTQNSNKQRMIVLKSEDETDHLTKATDEENPAPR